MNGESNHAFSASVLDARQPRLTWPLFAVQLCLLGAFVGMSLVLIAARDLISGASAAAPAATLALAVVGIVLATAAWRSAVRRVERLASEADAGKRQGTGTRAASSPARPLALVPHR